MSYEPGREPQAPEDAWDKERRDSVAQTPTEPFEPESFSGGPLTFQQMQKLTETDKLRQLEALMASVEGLREAFHRTQTKIDDNFKGWTYANAVRTREIKALDVRVKNALNLGKNVDGELPRIWERLGALEGAMSALEDASGSTEPSDRCRYCKQEIHKAGLSSVWYHTAGNQVTCGTVARP
jgi:hypothetical protein